MRFEFATATRIRFGAGTVKELAPAARALGSRVLFVEGVSGRGAGNPIAQMRSDGLFISEYHVQGEPTVESVLKGVEQANAARCDVVIGLGGGSVVDSGKAIA